MKLWTGLVFSAGLASAVGVALVACGDGNESTIEMPMGGLGGTSAAGGTIALGGTMASGGMTGSGGTGTDNEGGTGVDAGIDMGMDDMDMGMGMEMDAGTGGTMGDAMAMEDAATEDAGGMDMGQEPDAMPPALAMVFINEIMADSSMGSEKDWVELYNAGATAVDLSGYWMVDDEDGRTPSVLPEGTMIAAGGFLVLEEDAEGSFEFGLGKNGDTVSLYDVYDRLVDEVKWLAGETPENKTFGSFPDGSDMFATLMMPTPGMTNAMPAPVE
jgi:hypothetical protein